MNVLSLCRAMLPFFQKFTRRQSIQWTFIVNYMTNNNLWQFHKGNHRVNHLTHTHTHNSENKNSS